MKRGRIVGAERRGDAALGIAGVAFGRPGLGQDQDTAGSKADGRTQPCYAGADDDEVDDRQKMILGRWWLVIGRWSLVIGHWSLVVGHLVVRSALRQDRRFSRVLS
jgi:hypothetical protein